MTNKEKHELRIKIAKQLKQVQASLTFLSEEDLVILKKQLEEALQKALD